MAKLMVSFCLAALCLAASAQAELLLNSSAEEGPASTTWSPGDPWNENLEPYNWTLLTSGGWGYWKQEGYDAGYGVTGPAQDGQRYFVAGDNDTAGHWGAWYQEVSGLLEGEKITFGAWYKPEGTGQRAPWLIIQWPGSGAPDVNFQIANDPAFDPNETEWAYFDVETTVPSGSTMGRFLVYGESSLDGTAQGGCYFDGMTAYLTDGARSPSPANQSYVVPGTDVTLTWQVPDVNEVPAEPVAVYFGPAGSMTAVTPDTETSYNAGVLTDGLTYEWRVDMENQAGKSWFFTYANQAPVVDIDDDGINDVYFLNSKPDVDVDMELALAEDPDGYPSALTYLWEVLSSPVGSTVVFSDTQAAEPTVNVDLVGFYELKVTISDGEDTASDSVIFEVKASVDDYLALHMKMDGDLTDIVSGKTADILEEVRDAASRWIYQPSTTKVVSYVPGIDGQAADFSDGCAAGFYDDPNMLADDLGDGYAISMWVYAADYPTLFYMFAKGDGCEIGNVNGTGQIRTRMNYEGGWIDIRTDGYPLVDGQWVHIAYSYLNGTGTLFVNGTPKKTGTSSGPLTLAELSETVNQDVIIGGTARYNNATRSFDNVIDDVRVYSIGLTIDEVLWVLDSYGLSNFCGSYPVGDINQDCYTNMEDLAILVSGWLDCTDIGGTCYYSGD